MLKLLAPCFLVFFLMSCSTVSTDKQIRSSSIHHQLKLNTYKPISPSSTSLSIENKNMSGEVYHPIYSGDPVVNSPKISWSGSWTL